MTNDTIAAEAVRWRRTAGLDDMGPVRGSGLTRPSFLLRRGDGQVLQLSELLYLVVREVDAERDADQVAAAVSSHFGRVLGVDGLAHLADTKLAPMGLVERASAAQPHQPAPAPRSAPILALRLRRTLLPAPTVRAVGRVCAPLFRTEVVLLALAGFVALDVELFRRGGLLTALDRVFATPTFLLALLGLLTLGALVHEIGHAAACVYGGAEPGVIGAGVYLVFPAFFTNVTDSYRLGRAGRLRTDLGGLYFNVWCLFVLGAAYLTTGNGVFLLATVIMQIEMVQQLLPTVRFDGYFVLADLAGVPDLFARVRPILTGFVPGRPADPRVSELRRGSRWLVTAWVLCIVPMLAVGIGWLAVSLPYLITHVVTSIRHQSEVVASAWPSFDLASLVLAVLSIVLVSLPLVGLALLAWNTGRAMTRTATAWRRRHSDDGPRPDPTPALDASAFTDEFILGEPPAAPPSSGWRRAVYRGTFGTVNAGPTADELRREALLDRVRAPITGSRRVVVMSRKGGVGKTTITFALGSTYATVRGDRVVAVDANPDAGNLAHRVSRPSAKTITDVIADLGIISSYSDLRSYTSQAPDLRLEVLGSNDDPRIGSALDRDAYHQVIELLDRYYNLILLDTGTGILDSANQGLLAEADQLVLVLRPALDGARAAALTLDWLGRHGYAALVGRAVVVINGVRRDGSMPLDRIEEHFVARCADVVTVPWDPALEAGAQTSLDALQARTRDALAELAAAVAGHFATDTSSDTDR